MLTTDTGATVHAAQPGPLGGLLQMLASQLTAAGLEVREHQRGSELTEIAATNPRHPGIGRVVIDCEGFLTWERVCRFHTDHDVQAVTHTIRTLLDDHMSQQHQPARPQPSIAEPGSLSESPA
jgi:hypothetical protein